MDIAADAHLQHIVHEKIYVALDMAKAVGALRHQHATRARCYFWLFEIKKTKKNIFNKKMCEIHCTLYFIT